MRLEQKTIPACFHSIPIYSWQLVDSPESIDHQSLLSMSRTREYRANQTVIQPGDLPNIHILLYGKVEIKVLNKINESQSVRQIERYEILGVTEVLTDLLFGVELVALTSSVFGVIKRGVFEDFLSSQPEICIRLLELFSDDIGKTYQTFASSSF